MNPSQQFHSKMEMESLKLKWSNHSPNFISVFSQLLNSESLVDVTLAAGGKTIQAHRVVLSACSTYFQDLFVSHPGPHPIVILKDINFKDLCTVIHFMYYGEVNIQHHQLSSILKTAEVLHVKGFADVADKEQFSAALLTSAAPHHSHQQMSEESVVTDTSSANSKRKRHRHESSSSQSKSSQEQSVPSLQSRRETFQTSKEGTGSSFRSSASSFESNSVIKSQSSLLEQSSMESSVDHESSLLRDSEMKLSKYSTGSLDSALGMSENGGGMSSTQSKHQKRNRPLLRQERVTRKEGEKDSCSLVEGERASPIPHIISNLQPILPKSPKNSETETSEVRPRFNQSTTYLQLPSPTVHLPRQRSQPIPIQSVSSGTCVLPASMRNNSPTPPTTLNFITPNNIPIPTLALTPVSSASNIVIEQYPTILRVVSIEEVNMNNEAQASSMPILSRSQSQQLANSSSSNTLQVPNPDAITEISSVHGTNRLKVKAEENLRRSVSNPGPSHSPPIPSTNGQHCPVLRTGAALGCNYCWNTNDSHGRILRRKTKYHCPDCQANLCIVPCFQEFHEKFVTNETKTGGPHHKTSSSSHQMLSKMSSF